LFALLTGPAGDLNLDNFRFTGNYATNTAQAGRLLGGLASGVRVNGWAVGETRNFLVVGWPSFYGSEFGSVFGGLSPSFYRSYCSDIGTGAPGGFDPLTGSVFPALDIFGPSPSISGFLISRVPEPGFEGLAALGAALVIQSRRWSSRRLPAPMAGARSTASPIFLPNALQTKTTTT
jgi:hypothetical protein